MDIDDADRRDQGGRRYSRKRRNRRLVERTIEKVLLQPTPEGIRRLERLTMKMADFAEAGDRRSYKDLLDRWIGPVDRSSVQVNLPNLVTFQHDRSEEDPLSMAADGEALAEALSRGARFHHRNGSAGRENGTGGGTHD